MKIGFPQYFFCIYLLVLPKYWGKQIFALGIFPEVGQKQKTEKKQEREKEREKERKSMLTIQNTPGPAGGTGGRDQIT